MSLLFAALVSSCNNNEENCPENDSRIEIIPQLEDATSSRAAKYTWSNGDAIGWYLTDNNTTTYMGASYVNYKLSYTTSWSLDKAPLLSGSVGTVYAYYPYKSTYTANFNSIEVESASQTDYMYGMTTGFTSATPSQTLTMKHALSQIVVKIVKGTYGYTGSVTSVKVNGANIGTNGTLNATTGVLTVNSGTSSDITLPSGGTQTINATGATWSGIVLPVSKASQITVKVVMDGVPYNVVLPSITPIAGQRHNFVITANSTGLSISSVSLQAWGDGSGGSGTIQ